MTIAQYKLVQVDCKSVLPNVDVEASALFPRLLDAHHGSSSVDLSRLTSAQWAAFKRAAVSRARDERNRAIRRLWIAISLRIRRTMRNADAWIARQWRAYQAARRRRRAMFELDTLSDFMLKDIGLRRCDIPSIVYRHDSSRIY
jgi:uncharacterized protein YjiS (DUF1127 family)